MYPRLLYSSAPVCVLGTYILLLLVGNVRYGNKKACESAAELVNMSNTKDAVQSNICADTQSAIPSPYEVPVSQFHHQDNTEVDPEHRRMGPVTENSNAMIPNKGVEFANSNTCRNPIYQYVPSKVRTSQGT